MSDMSDLKERIRQFQTLPISSSPSAILVSDLAARVAELEAALEAAASLAREALDADIAEQEIPENLLNMMRGGYFERILDATTRAAVKGD